MARPLRGGKRPCQRRPRRARYRTLAAARRTAISQIGPSAAPRPSLGASPNFHQGRLFRCPRWGWLYLDSNAGLSEPRHIDAADAASSSVRWGCRWVAGYEVVTGRPKGQRPTASRLDVPHHLQRRGHSYRDPRPAPTRAAPHRCQPRDRERCRREGRADDARPRLGHDDARHLRAPVRGPPRRGRRRDGHGTGGGALKAVKRRGICCPRSTWCCPPVAQRLRAPK